MAPNELDAERQFELDIDGHELIGFIDAVYRTPEDELVVIDYKATERRCDIENDDLLPIYLLACRDLYDERVQRAGYACVGSIGPKLEVRSFDENEFDVVRETVTTIMNLIHELAFRKYDPREHCQWCRHNKLSCANEWRR